MVRIYELLTFTIETKQFSLDKNICLLSGVTLMSTSALAIVIFK